MKFGHNLLFSAKSNVSILSTHRQNKKWSSDFQKMAKVSLGDPFTTPNIFYFGGPFWLLILRGQEFPTRTNIRLPSQHMAIFLHIYKKKSHLTDFKQKILQGIILFFPLKNRAPIFSPEKNPENKFLRSHNFQDLHSIYS